MLDHCLFQLEGIYRQQKNPNRIAAGTSTITRIPPNVKLLGGGMIEQNDTISIKARNVKALGNMSSYALTANAFYDNLLADRLSWYVGEGIGIAWSQTQLSYSGLDFTPKQYDPFFAW